MVTRSRIQTRPSNISYVMVGSEEKKQHLVKNMSVPMNRIFNSHDESFVFDLM